MKKLFHIAIIETKILLKSIWLLIYLIPTIILTIATVFSFAHQNFGDNIGTWVNQNGYITIYISFVSLTMGVFVAQKENDIFDQIMTPVFKNCVKYLSLLFFTSIVLIIPILIIIIYNFFRPIEIDLLLNYLFYVVMLWFLQILFFTAVGYFLGFIINNKIAYYIIIVPAIVFSLFFSIIIHIFFLNYYNLIPNFVYDLLNTNIDNPSVHKFLSNGISFNLYFVWDKLFVFILSILMLFLVFIIANSRNRYKIYKLMCILCVLTSALSISISQSGLNQSKSVHLNNVIQKLTNEVNDIDASFTVKSYNMNINLKESFANSCNISLHCKESQNSLILKLDNSSLKITSVKINNVPFKYQIKNDYIYIYTNFQKGKIYNAEINYNGRIDYEDNFGYRWIYVYDKSSYLPEVYDWYPQVINGQLNPIQFNLKVKTENKLVSNLSSEVMTPKHGIISLDGLKNNFYISTGYYTSAKINGVNIICAEEIASSNSLPKLVDEIKSSKTEELSHDTNQFYEPKQNTEIPCSQILSNGKLIILPMSINGIYYFYTYDNSILLSY